MACFIEQFAGGFGDWNQNPFSPIIGKSK